MTQNRNAGRLTSAIRRLACWSALAGIVAATGIAGSGPALAAARTTAHASATAAAGDRPAARPGSRDPVIRPDVLTGVTWSVTSTKLGATGVTYTFSFTAPSPVTLFTSITMTVPPGTSGTPAIGAGTTPTGLLGSTVTLASNTLTVTGLTLTAGATSFNMVITGLTNTSTAGTYTSVETVNLLVLGNSGTSNSLTFGLPTLTSPSSLSWSAALTGGTQNLVDLTSGDEQFTAADVETLGTGWNITVSATTFTGAKGSFANTGTFVFNGSLSSITATGKPTATCTGTCTLPTNSTTYPVAITTAASAPTPVKVYSTASATGVGTMTLGGSTAANPIGWWLTFPGSTKAGSYASNVTITIATGP